ncbi:hypothetical protein SUDANB15_04604 [Streptomyces sp. enrichment culture]|uniref:hypothetical protein n=1 Tax=Streptomyces sp. enrichment culture TaxID=1795815 RepID=UPI003F54560F
MGERQSDGGPAGRRRVHPEGAPPGHRTAGRDGSVGGRPHAVDAAGLEALLAASLIRDSVDAAAEQRAVAAFRAAREAGAHRARTRRRDDWRPRRRRLGSHSVKTVLSVLLGGLTLGGVAVAGIGAAGSATDGPARDDRRAHASPDTPGPSTGGPLGESTGPGSAPAGPDRPAAARDTEAHCRAYEKVEGRGKALDATAWKRLTEAAGGEAKVDAYCAEQLEQATAEERRGGPAAGKDAGEAGRAGNGSSGTARDGASDNAGNAGNASGGGPAGNDNGNGGSGAGGSGAANSGSGSRQGKPAQPGADRP